MDYGHPNCDLCMLARINTPKKLWLTTFGDWPHFIVRAKTAGEAVVLAKDAYPEMWVNRTIYIDEISLIGKSEIVYQSDDL